MGDAKSDEFKKLLREAQRLNERLGRLAGEQKVTLFGEFAQAYVKIKQANPTLRDSTKRSTEYQVRMNLLPAFSTVPLGGFTNVIWLTWVSEVRARPAEFRGGITRFFNARKTLLEILNYAREQGEIDRVPRLDNPDAPKKVGRVLENWEVWAILTNTTYRIFRLFFYAMFRMGCRPREILQWEWSMIRWDEPGQTWIDIPARISKCDRDRSIPIDPKLSKQIHRIWKRGNGSIFVFPSRVNPAKPQLSYHGAWTTAITYAGIDAMPYDFRRSAITRWMAEGKSPAFVAMILDTSVKMIEKVYLKPDKKAMEGIFK